MNSTTPCAATEDSDIQALNDHMRRPTLHIILSIFAAALCGICVSTAKTPRTDTSRNLKADYIFLEGVAAMNESRYDDAMLLFDRAAALNPSDRDIAAVRGELIFATASGDSADYACAYTAIRDRFLARPGDADNGRRFANLAAKLFRADDVRMAYALLSREFPERTDFALSRAWTLAQAYQRGDTAALDSALDIYDRLEAGLGPDPTIINHRIRALSVRADTAAIVTQLHRLFATAPSDPEICLMTGSTFYAIGMSDSAIVYLDRACAIDSTSGEAYLTRAEYYLSEGDSARYDVEVFRALESPNLDFQPKLSLLSSYVRSLYTDSAHTESIGRLFSVMQTIHPGEAELHNLYGSYLATIDSLDAAAEQFGYAADLDPDEPQNWQFLIQTAVGAGDTIRAIDAGRRATPRFPDNLYFPFVTAALLDDTRGPRAAISLIDSVDVSDFNNDVALSMYHTTRGDYLYKLGLTDSAFAQYEVALDYNPHNAGAQNNAAYFMACESVNLPRARQLIESALHEEPLNPTYIDTYAWVLFKQGDYDGARRQIDAVLAMTADSTDITPPGVAASDTAAVSEGYAEVAGEIVSDPFEPSAEIYEHAGDIYYMTGDTDSALEYWRRALILAPASTTLPRKIKQKSL